MARDGFVDIADDIISDEVLVTEYRPVDNILATTVRRMLRRGVDPKDIPDALLVHLEDVLRIAEANGQDDG